MQIGDRMIKIMFLCTGNSCRSQMAEGFARELGKGLVEARSAGLTPVGVNPRAVAVMKEIGVGISDQESKAIDENLLKEMDIIVTLCGHAESSCPTTPSGVKRIHMPVDDPVGATGTEDEIMKEFRRARDEIKKRITGLIDNIRIAGKQNG